MKLKLPIYILILFSLMLSLGLPTYVEALSDYLRPFDIASSNEPVQETATYIPDNQLQVGQEIVSLRTENTKTTYLGKVGKNDKFSIDSSIGPIHYKDNYSDSSEQWKNIDLTFVNGKITKAPYELTITDNNIAVRDKKTNSVVSISLNTINSKTISGLSYAYTKGKASVGNIATDTDLEINASNTRIRFTRVLKSSSAPLEAKFNVVQMGIGIKLGYQAKDSRTGFGSSVPVIATLDKGVLTETLSPKGSLTYPVRIDPTLDITVAANTDDAWYRASDDYYETGGNQLYIGASGATTGADIGARFLNVTIPGVSTITTSYLVLIAKTDQAGDDCDAIIRGEDVDDAATFSTKADFLTRRGVGSTTAAEVAWNTIAHMTAATSYNSPEIKTVIAEIIARVGWASGNDIVVFFGDRASTSTAAATRHIKDFDSDGAAAPTLHIEYTIPTPTVITATSTLVEETTATIGGNITAINGANVTTWGSQYGTATGTYTTWANLTGTVSTDNYEYTNNLAVLTQANEYFYRAFAENSNGIGYGSELTFFTKPGPPTGLSITAANATGLNATWTDFVSGAGATSYSYIRYKTVGYPADRTEGTLCANTTGTNACGVDGLVSGTEYFFRAWTWSIEGGLGQWSDTTTDQSGIPVAAPIVTTSAATNVEETTCTGNGAITDLSGEPDSDMRGWDIGTATATYTTNTTENGSFLVAPFTTPAITALTSGDEYFYRAKAHNVHGWGYGAELTFFTKPPPPTVLVITVANSTGLDFTWTAATVGAGATAYTVVRYSSVGYPADYTAGTLAANITGTTAGLSGLVTNTTYYFRAWTWAIEGGLGKWSDDFAFGLGTPYGPAATGTEICTGFNREWAVVNGNITSIPGGTLSIRGFNYGTTTAYGSNQTEACGNVTGAYDLPLTGLTPNTVYHYRATSYNGQWAFGQDEMFSTMDTYEPYEHFTLADTGASQAIYGGNWQAQTFTTNSTAYSVTSIKLKVYRTGTVSATVYVSLRATSGGIPTGADLVTGSTDILNLPTAAGTIEFPVTETTLEPNSMYAIVIRCPAGSITNYVTWRGVVGAGSYDRGQGLESTVAGSVWTAPVGDIDHIFELWGQPGVEVYSARAYQSYSSTNDWIFVIHYRNIYPPYYPGKTVQQWFSVQLFDSTNHIVIASTPCQDYGSRPGSVYLSSSLAAPLTWGDSRYRIRLYRNGTTGYEYFEYPMYSGDWIGTDLANLDRYCTSTATLMNIYYNDTFTQYSPQRGIVLNNAGGILFANGVTGLQSIRPGLFLTATIPLVQPASTFTNPLQTQYVWQVQIGPTLTAILASMGIIAGGVNGAMIGAILGFLIWAIVAAVVYPPGHSMAAMVLDTPLLIMIVWIGFTEIAIAAVLAILFIVLLVWQFVLKST